MIACTRTDPKKSNERVAIKLLFVLFIFGARNKYGELLTRATHRISHREIIIIIEKRSLSSLLSQRTAP